MELGPGKSDSGSEQQRGQGQPRSPRENSRSRSSPSGARIQSKLPGRGTGPGLESKSLERQRSWEPKNFLEPKNPPRGPKPLGIRFPLTRQDLGSFPATFVDSGFREEDFPRGRSLHPPPVLKPGIIRFPFKPTPLQEKSSLIHSIPRFPTALPVLPRHSQHFHGIPNAGSSGIIPFFKVPPFFHVHPDGSSGIILCFPGTTFP